MRAYIRLATVVAWSLMCAVVRLALAPLRFINPDLEHRWWRAIYMNWARGVTRILRIQIECRGPSLTPPFLLVSNHLSMMDIFVLASRFGCIFVSRADLADWPLFGFIARQGGTLFIDRKDRRDTHRVSEEIAAALAKGHGVSLFPEGSVSVDAEVRDFKPSLLEPAVRGGLPVHYASISYETAEGGPSPRESVVWRNGMGLFGHFFAVAALPGFKALVTVGAEPLRSTDRKALAESLCAAVRGIFIPPR